MANVKWTLRKYSECPFFLMLLLTAVQKHKAIGKQETFVYSWQNK